MGGKGKGGRWVGVRPHPHFLDPPLPRADQVCLFRLREGAYQLLAISVVSSVSADFGGYFGLFLGGSAISFFEFIDLIIYNLLIKLTTNKSVASDNNVVDENRRRNPAKPVRRWRPLYAKSRTNGAVNSNSFEMNYDSRYD